MTEILMINIVFVSPDGTRMTVHGRAGDSLMQAAVAGGVDGIVAECGGSMMCATCHCYVDDGWAKKAGARRDGEAEMLESAASEVREHSRLSCQITLTPALDGIVIHLPETQR
jgi:ferredoxin, 2Fe-2S